MTRPLRLGVAIAAAVAATVALGALSRVPYQADRSAHAILRLAWRTPGVRVEECRPLTQEELDNLPSHMQRQEICEGRLLPYRLRVTIDGDVVVDEEIRPAGAREDRPLFVFHDFPLTPGRHPVSVVFERDLLEPEAEGAAAVPLRLEFDRTMAFEARRITLVTYDAERKALAVVE